MRQSVHRRNKGLFAILKEKEYGATPMKVLHRILYIEASSLIREA